MFIEFVTIKPSKFCVLSGFVKLTILSSNMPAVICLIFNTWQLVHARDKLRL